MPTMVVHDGDLQGVNAQVMNFMVTVLMMMIFMVTMLMIFMVTMLMMMILWLMQQ